MRGRSRAPVRTALGGRPRGKAPLGSVVVKPQLLETVHQAVQPLPLLADDLPVVGQGIKQRLSLWHKQAPVESNEKRIQHERFKKRSRPEKKKEEKKTTTITVKRLEQHHQWTKSIRKYQNLNKGQRPSEDTAVRRRPAAQRAPAQRPCSVGAVSTTGDRFTPQHTQDMCYFLCVNHIQ